MKSIRKFYATYSHTIWFAVGLTVCAVISQVLAYEIPLDIFNNIITPYSNLSIGVVCLFGALLIFRHSGGMRIRRAWGYTLLLWGIAESALVISATFYRPDAIQTSSGHITLYEMMIGNTLGYFLLLYPTELLRPGWLNAKRALLLFLPIILLGALDYIVPFDLRPINLLYPLLLFILLCWHVRTYHRWCEENYSSMDDIDVQWVLRFLYMVVLIGAAYIYICIATGTQRVFTQQLLALFFFIYSTEQILYRRDPWAELKEESEKGGAESTVSKGGKEHFETEDNEANRAKLEEWMATKKPYLNPEFRLLDLREIIPMNRTYLSQFISTEYRCNFYLFVAKYRIEEAQRLMQEYPEMKLQDIAEKSGFTSLASLSHTFSREVGMSPSEWSKKFVNK